MMGRLGLASLLPIALALQSAAASAADRPAATVAELRAAIDDAGPGDAIVLAPGVYELPRIAIRRSGRLGRPITLRPAQPGTVELRSRAVELFHVSGSDWVFEDLDIAGVCDADARCEHAFHLVGGADRVVIRRNRVHDFNAHIKGNGENGAFPEAVTIEGNILFDTSRRSIDLPLVPVDVVGGRRWIMRDNLIADFGKVLTHPPRRPDDFGYAIFLKGNASNGLIERNLVICGLALPPAPFTRGISLGGSGTDPGLCERDCAMEHRDGIVRNNLVVDCPGEAGIDLYKAENSRVTGNALIGNAGILARSPETTATIAGNILSGKIAVLDGADIAAERNTPAAASVDAEEFCRRLSQMSVGAAPPGLRDLCRSIGPRIAAYRQYVRSLRRAAAAAR